MKTHRELAAELKHCFEEIIGRALWDREEAIRRLMSVVNDLAGIEAQAITNDYERCILCFFGPIGGGIEEHKPTCPWRRTRELTK